MAKNCKSDVKCVISKTELRRLIDEYGEIHTRIAPDVKRLKALRETLDDRIEDGMSGKVFRINVDTQTQDRLNITRIRADMPFSWIKKYEEETNVRKFRVKKLKE